MSDRPNSASTLGEAIGKQLERALQARLANLLDGSDFELYTHKGNNSTTGRPIDLKLADNSGIKYSVDGLIVDSRYRPILVLESKFLRYKKHNRDKGSWICFAHRQIRRRYQSIRVSLAVLAGRWSAPSLKMMEDNRIRTLCVDFDKVSEIFLESGLNIDWEERDEASKVEALDLWNELGDDEKLLLGARMVNVVDAPLQESVLALRSADIPRRLESVTVEVSSNLDEVRESEYGSAEEAAKFLGAMDEDVSWAFGTEGENDTPGLDVELADVDPVQPDDWDELSKGLAAT